MELQLIPFEKFQLFLICAARVGALVGSMPVLGRGQTPARVRTGFALALSLLLFPIVSPRIPPMSFEPLSLALVVANEALLGFALALIAKLVFTAAEFGGTVVGYQMGFAAANIYDPQTQQQISLISRFQSIFAIFIFLSLDAHHQFLQAIVHSYEVLPPGYLDFSGQAVPFLMQLAGKMFIVGIKICAPILAVLLLSGLGLGIMARVFPQLNVFVLSFPINIGLGFLVIGLTLNLVAFVLSQEFDALGSRFMQLFQLM
jgi:flagellar biosynthetic protein FliR